MTEENRIKRSSCPMSCALDILGDKWTLLVIRDIMFLDKRYFGDFLTSPEKIASNILSRRLKKLEESNIILRQLDPGNARRAIYTLTEKGLDLLPAMMELLRWGAKHDSASEEHDCSIRQLAQNPDTGD
ncbi:MAG: helix-turn-helix transcriptional regulator [Betaproteobacteria bacterium]|nr:helix-turn-helix transcriptional regulator [Betaproteobacteria bacterium]